MVSPKQKKRVVKDAAERGLCSLRRACAYLSLSWSTFSYRPKQASKKAQQLAERIVALSWDFVHDRTDNGGPLKMMTLIDEYTRKCLDIRVAHQGQQWLSDKKIKVIYIDPGSPWQNGSIESFHNRLRDECLNREVLLSVAEAQVVIDQWRQTYNNEHPHSRLGFKSPQEFVRFLSDLGRVRATPSLRQDLSYTSILKPLTPGNSLT